MKTRPRGHRNLVLVIIALFIFPSSLMGQQRERSPFRPDPLRFADGVLHTWSAPARWKSKDWLVLGGVLAGTSVLTFLDEPVRNFWSGQDSEFMSSLERVGYHYGKPYTAFAFTGGFYLTGLIFRSQWAKETGLMLGTALVSSGTILGLLKNAAGRGRPAPGMDHLEFRPFDDSPAWHSFPSGHTSISFGISLVMARRVENVPLKVLFYSLAGITAASRMSSDSHWISDVGFGGMLAWFCADTAIDRLEANRIRPLHRRNNTLAWRVYPYPGGITLRAALP